jgi:hypothetical protein
MIRSASVKRLMQIKDVTPEIAKKVKTIWVMSKSRDKAMSTIDRLIGTYGVESLGQSKRTGQSIDYCQASDSYDTTILFCGDNLTVGCWGDLVEHNAVWDWNDENRPGWPR